MPTFSKSAFDFCDNFSRKNSLTCRRVSPDGISLNGVDFYIYISMDREGVSMAYVDCVGMLVYGLDLFLFECRNARVGPYDPTSGMSPDDTFEVSQSLKMLSGWGEDIINGGRSWIKEYPWKPRPIVDSEIAGNEEMFRRRK